MSQRFNLKIEDMRQNNPASPDFEPESRIKDDDLYYPTYGNVRHICFCWQDGKKVFLNYAYLISCAYDALENCITITFSTHEVALKGVNLHVLFFKLMGQQVRMLQCVDARYNSLGGDRAVINSIVVSAVT